jgi:uncharacterized protein YdaU (DUF1376 family)
MAREYKFDFYIRDWLTGTRELSLEARGLYIDLISLLAEHGGRLRLDPPGLCRMLGIRDHRTVNRVLGELVMRSKIESEAGWISNPRMTRELAKIQALRTRKKGGKNGPELGLENPPETSPKTTPDFEDESSQKSDPDFGDKSAPKTDPNFGDVFEPENRPEPTPLDRGLDAPNSTPFSANSAPKLPHQPPKTASGDGQLPQGSWSSQTPSFEQNQQLEKIKKRPHIYCLDTESIQTPPPPCPVLSRRADARRQDRTGGKGARISSHFSIDEPTRQWAFENGIIDPDPIVESFRDYWSAKAGPTATKLDWNAAFRTWCRRFIEKTQAETQAQGAANHADQPKPPRHAALIEAARQSLEPPEPNPSHPRPPLADDDPSRA